MADGGVLEGRVGVVTGASSGIGMETVRELAKAGARVVMTARRAGRIEALAKETGAVAIPGDITGDKLPGKLLAAALEKFGRCDIFVNNAGVLETGTVEETDIDVMCRMVRVNVEAAFRAAYVFLKHFKKENRGHLVNLSSILGTKVRATTGAYAGTKYAIEALSEALRMELAGTGVHVTCIEPGLVLTELHDRWPVHPAKSLNIARPLRPPDIVRCIMFALTQPDHVRIPRLMIMPADHQL